MSIRLRKDLIIDIKKKKQDCKTKTEIEETRLDTMKWLQRERQKLQKKKKVEELLHYVHVEFEKHSLKPMIFFILLCIFEPPHGKNNNLHMQKQRHRSAVQ